jgi:hypothetical protein
MAFDPEIQLANIAVVARETARIEQARRRKHSGFARRFFARFNL